MAEISQQDLENQYRVKQGMEVIDHRIIRQLAEKYKNREDWGYDIEKEESVLRKITFKSIAFQIERYLDSLELREDLLRDKEVLDIGSGNNLFGEYIEMKYGTRYTALDVDLTALRDHSEAVVADARHLPFKDNQFDLVMSKSSMPHVLAPHEAEAGDLKPYNENERQEILKSILSVFREAYYVTKKQVRLDTFSDAEINSHVEDRKRNNLLPHVTELTTKSRERVSIVKEALSIFEAETGAQCVFKDEEKGGLIIITKK
ncbi:MAG: Methyltransferase domain [Candidatus Nomurabacteria bacterium]|nr:Methyltransferase domain [Candidatus Nomurabacteria bacterium]